MALGRLRNFALIVCFGSVALGCQSYEEGMRVLCDSPKNADLSQHDPAERMRKFSEWIDDHVKNGEVRELFNSLSDMSPEQRVVAIERAAAKAKIDPCLVAEAWKQASAEPSAP